jgi:HEAT repeat protein
VRAGAAKVLGLIGSAAKPASAALVQGLSDPDAGVRLASAWALGRVEPGEAAAAALEKALGDADPLVRVQAAETLTRLGKALVEARKVFVLELKAAMADISSTANRNLVVWATEKFSTLGIPPGEIVAALSSALGNEDLEDEPEILVQILTILRGIGPAAREAIPSAADLLASSDYDKVIVACAQFLGSLGAESRGSVRVLIEKGLKDKDFETIRQACAEALGAIGPDAREALPLLEELKTKDKFEKVQKAAGEAIQKIR